MTTFTDIIVIISIILLINALLPGITVTAFHTQGSSYTEFHNFKPGNLGPEGIGTTISIQHYIDTARQALREGNFTVIGNQLDLIEETIFPRPNNASNTIVNSSNTYVESSHFS